MFDLIDVVFTHLPRIRELRVCVPNIPGWPPFYDPPWLGRLAPQLRQLSVRIKCAEDDTRPWIPEQLLQSELPALISLHISDPYFRWMDHALPTTLTTLRIEGLAWIVGQKRTAEAIQTLRNLPQLQHLALENEITKPGAILAELPGRAWLAAHTLPTVSLSGLETLCVQGTMHVCLHMLTHIIMPERCTVRMVLDVFPGTEESITQWVGPINDRLLSGPRAGRRIPATMLAIEGYSRESHGFLLKLWTTPSADPSTAEPYLTIDVTTLPNILPGDLMASQWLTMLHSLVGGMALADVQTVHICEMHYFLRSVEFKRVLCGMPAVRTLCIHDWTLEQLAVGFTGRGTYNGGSCATLPNLKRLELWNVNFPVRPLTYQDDQNEQNTKYLSEITGLVARKGLGSGSKKLVLKKCYNLSETVVQRMALEVGAVEWDGVQQPGVNSDMLDCWMVSGTCARVASAVLLFL